MKKYILLPVMFALLALSGQAAGSLLSSGEVKSIGETYLSGATEQAALTDYTLNKPLDIDGNGYWVVYYFPSSAPSGQYSTSFDKIVVADEQGGGAVRDTEILANVFSTDYEYAWERNYLKGQVELSYGDIAAGVNAVLPAIRAAEKNIEAVRNSALNRNYSASLDAHFSLLSDKLSDLTVSLEDLESQEVGNGREYQNAFYDSANPSDFHDSIRNYNATFSKLASFMEKAEDFYALLASNDVYAQLTSDEAAVLQKIYSQGLGTDKFYSSRQLREEIQGQYNAFEKSRAAAVNDSVRNSQFRIAKITAQKAFKEAKSTSPAIDYVLDRYKQEKSTFDGCSLAAPIRKLNESWVNLTNVMGSQSTVSLKDYESVPQKSVDAVSQKDAIVTGLQNCLRVTTTPKPVDTKPVSDFLTVVIVVAIAGLGYLQYRKWQQKKEGEEVSE